ncbi:MAG: FHA domain-containing protein [Chloroflexi bacterium]|nr:FHA domain-containing protein [Chloroflexota bacterium]
MNTHAFIKFCPSCKLGIDANSIVCRHCGAILDLTPPGSTPKDNNLVAGLPRPKAGLAVYPSGTTTPIAVTEDKEFVLGRETGGESEKIVDLTSLDGFAMGVSRRHAMIRAVENGYMLIDLNSSNGTWLNGQILVPTILYELPSGSNVQLGHLKLVVIYQ